MNLLLLAATLLAQDYPARQGLVNDFADELDSGTKTEIHEKLVALREAGKGRMVVVTVKTLNGQSIEEFSHGLLKKWGIGTKEENDGILLIHAPVERKIRIETGYGMESRLPDIVAKRILSTRVTPLLKSGQFSKALMEGVLGVISELTPPDPEPKEPEKQGAVSTGSGIGTFGWTLMAVLFVAFFLFFLWKSGAFDGADDSRSSDLMLAGITVAAGAAALEAARRARENSLPNPSGMDGGLGVQGIQGQSGLGPQRFAGAFQPLPLVPPSTTPYRYYSPPSPQKKKKRSDDDSSSSYSSPSRSDDSSSSSSDSSSDSSFGGGDSGGGGASDSY